MRPPARPLGLGLASLPSPRTGVPAGRGAWTGKRDVESEVKTWTGRRDYAQEAGSGQGGGARAAGRGQGGDLDGSDEAGHTGKRAPAQSREGALEQD